MEGEDEDTNSLISWHHNLTLHFGTLEVVCLLSTLSQIKMFDQRGCAVQLCIMEAAHFKAKFSGSVCLWVRDFVWAVYVWVSRGFSVRKRGQYIHYYLTLRRSQCVTRQWWVRKTKASYAFWAEVVSHVVVCLVRGVCVCFDVDLNIIGFWILVKIEFKI